MDQKDLEIIFLDNNKKINIRKNYIIKKNVGLIKMKENEKESK